MAITITPDQRLQLLGLFILNDDLQHQQEAIMRNVDKIVSPATAFLEATPVNDHVSDALYGTQGHVTDRLDAMLRKMGVAVKVPVPLVAEVNFFSLKVLEQARVWLRTEFSNEGGGSETMETHYLTNDLMRIPAFNSWVHLLNPKDARDVYDREEMLQYHKDDIITAAMNGGFNPYM